MSIQLLELKLKRLKIKHKKEGSKIIIGSSKIDTTTLLGLIILPLVASFFVLYLAIYSNSFHFKFIVLIFSFLSMAIFNFGRIGIQKGNNKAIKILQNNTLTIKQEKESKKFNSKNILNITYEIKGISEDTYEGKLSLIDMEENHHIILSFDDEDPNLIENDLKWFLEYFVKHLQLTTTS